MQEESEDGWVSGIGILDTIDGLNDDVGVTLDDPVIKLLRSTEVVGVRVDEETRFQIADGHLNSEVGIGGDIVHVLGEHKLARGLSRLGGDVTHGDGVARSTLNLKTIGDGLTHTKVDKVVGGSE